MATGQLQALLDSFEARLSTVEKSVVAGGRGGGSGAAPMASSSRGLPGAGGGGGGGQVSPSVAAFDAYCSARLDPFVAACSTLGGGAEKAVSRSSLHLLRRVL